MVGLSTVITEAVDAVLSAGASKKRLSDDDVDVASALSG
jgi:hypothetical protein